MGPLKALCPDASKQPDGWAYGLFHDSLVAMSHEVFKMKFSDQQSFIRNFFAGRSRYGAAPGAMLDYTGGYCMG